MLEGFHSLLSFRASFYPDCGCPNQSILTSYHTELYKYIGFKSRPFKSTLEEHKQEIQRKNLNQQNGWHLNYKAHGFLPIGWSYSITCELQWPLCWQSRRIFVYSEMASMLNNILSAAIQIQYFFWVIKCLVVSSNILFLCCEQAYV